MGWYQIQDSEDIAGIIKELISERADLNVRIRCVGLACSSRLLAILPALEPQRMPGRSFGRLRLLIEDLTPKQGDDLIRDFPEVDIRFGIQDYGGRFCTNYQGISRHYPHYGLILDFPATMALLEESGVDGFTHDALKPFLALLRIAAGSRQAQVCEFPVISWSDSGLSLLVTEKDADLMTLLGPGERIPEITLFAESGFLVVEGVVRHTWKVADGLHQRNHILDLEIRAEEEEFAQPSDFACPSHEAVIARTDAPVGNGCGIGPEPFLPST